MGYSKESKGSYFYNPSENKVFVSRKAVFLEKEFISKKNSGSRIQLEEVQNPQIPEEDSMEIGLESQGVVETEPITQEPRRSGRIRHEPERSTSYREAIESPNSAKWLGAMESEMQSM